MDANFNKCIEFILEAEGGYVNHSKDPGGETNFGIADARDGVKDGMADLDGDKKPDVSIKNLTKDQAKQVYYTDYWLKLKCDKMPLPVALMVFDSGVNQGLTAAAKILQRALGVTDDGVIGNVTVGKIMNTKPSELLPELCARRCHYYSGTRNVDTFGLGWFRRAVDCYEFAIKLKNS